MARKLKLNTFIIGAMKAFSIIIVMLVVLIGCTDEKTGRSEDELLSLFFKYHEEADIDSMMDLFYQKDTPDIIINNTKEWIESILGEKIKNTTFRDLTEDEKASSIKGIPYEGKTLIHNLVPLKLLAIDFEVKGGGGAGMSLSVGKDKDTYYFILYKFK